MQRLQRPGFPESVMLKDYRRHPQTDEVEVAQAMVELIEDRKVNNSPNGRTQRDVQSGGHSCVTAEFTVEPALRDECRVGVFSEGATFLARICFSNAGPVRFGESSADNNHHVRAMTISLVGALSWSLLSHPRMNLGGLYRASVQDADLLDIQYFSSVPATLGSSAVRFSARPSSLDARKLPDHPSDDYLLQRMKKRLAREEAMFDFMIQFQVPSDDLPIEVAGTRWNEVRSPFIKVASIRIPRQSFDSDQQLEYCDHLSFNDASSDFRGEAHGAFGRAPTFDSLYRSADQRK